MESVVGFVALAAGLIIGLGAAGACIGIGIMGSRFLRSFCQTARVNEYSSNENVFTGWS